MGDRWMSVFARVNVAAAGDDAGLKSFKSKMENGKKKIKIKAVIGVCIYECSKKYVAS